MLREFREFAVRRNVLDLAIGVIIGGAFGKIVTSFVNDIIMPPIGLALGNVNFANLFVSLSGGKYTTLADAQAAGVVTLNYGAFLNTIVDFIIVAIVIFLLVRQVNKLQKPAAPASIVTKECPYCVSTISLKAVRCPYCTSQLS